MYQALYRKWRPRVFADVVGQEHVTTTLRRQVAEGRTSHAYLFTGTRGTGKTTCAKILSRAVNCENPQDGDPCCECPSCVGLESGRYLDVLELDAASNNGVDQVRALRDEAVYSPANVKKRVYIVDEVHMLSTPAFNALLKILEEPPEHLMFILATTELHKVPATILSRCQRYSFKRILPRDIEQRLQYVAEQEHIDLTPDGAELLSRLADGALRDGLSLLDQCAAAGGRIDGPAVLEALGLAGQLQTVELMEHILRRDARSALTLFGKLYEGGKDPGAVLGELSGLTRDLLLRKIAPEGGTALRGYDDATLDRLGKGAGGARLLYLSTTLQKAGAELYNSTNRRTDAELCLLRLCDETLSSGMEALSARVERLEEALSHGAAVSGVTAVSPSASAGTSASRPAENRTTAKAQSISRPAENRTALKTQPTVRPPETVTPSPPSPPPEPPYDGPPPPEDRDAPPWDDAPPVPDSPPPWDDAPPVQEPLGNTEPPPLSAPPVSANTATPSPATPRPTVPTVPAVPDAAPVHSSGDASWWPAVAERCKARLSPMYRAFLGQCTGTLSEGVLTLYGPDSTTLGRLDNDRVRGVLMEETGAAQVRYQEGAPPAGSPRDNLRELVEASGQYDAITVRGSLDAL